MQTHPPRAFPWEIEPPVGTCQRTGKQRPKARARRPRERTCVNKKCGRKYHARRWNQRYCQDLECRREVNRWLAARRQAKHREAATAKAQHAQAEKARRQQAKSVPNDVQKPELTPTRGHAAKPFFPLPYAIGQAATNPP
jgi:hypothetical protein